MSNSMKWYDQCKAEAAQLITRIVRLREALIEDYCVYDLTKAERTELESQLKPMLEYLARLMLRLEHSGIAWEVIVK